jgi:hypothetical protein
LYECIIRCKHAANLLKLRSKKMAAMREWSEEELRLLDKACNKYPMVSAQCGRVCLHKHPMVRPQSACADMRSVVRCVPWLC